MTQDSRLKLKSMYFRPWVLGIAAEWCVFVLFALAWSMGYSNASPLWLVLPVLVFHLLLWMLFSLVQKGYTAHFRDARMTFLNAWLAIVVQIPILFYVKPEARDVLVFAFCIPLLFGIVRLTYRQSLHLALYPILGYLVVIWLGEGNPFSFENRELLFVRFLMFSALCIWIALISGYIHQIRRKLMLKTKALNERSDELMQAQGRLLESAHRAGMAEAAGEVLHNVGHILNSVNVSAAVLEEQLAHLKPENLNRLSALATRLLLREPHEQQTAADLARLRLLPEAIQRLAQEQARECGKLGIELGHLRGFVDRMRDILAAHRHFLGHELSLMEQLSPSELLEDLLTSMVANFEVDRIKLEKNLSPLPIIRLQRSKFRHVLQNLIENALEAMQTMAPEQARILRVEGFAEPERIRIRIADSGKGIAEEKLHMIFSHGFTTKENGLGFGLHYCACAMQEMGGTIQAGTGGELGGLWLELQFKR